MAEVHEISADGLPVDEIGSWSLEKHNLLGLYGALFSTGMKNRWNLRVYLDLYAGPGHARIRGTEQMVETSPLIALRVPDPFDRYIFCDKDPEFVDALRQRVERDAPGADVRYHVGDCNEIVSDLLADIPQASKARTVLSLAFLDPRGIGGLKFSTLERLSERYVDFIMLLALSMDAHRFQTIYAHEDNPTVDAFLGDSSWRERWEKAASRGVEFRRFLAEEFAKQMESLGCLSTGRETMKEIRSDEKNLPLYHIAFFSRHDRGYTFWRQVLKYSTPQMMLDFE